MHYLEKETTYKPLSPLLNERIARLWQLIGNTPMLELHYLYKDKPGRIFVKCEHYNLTGSIKDRMALHILHKAYLENSIGLGDTILEATSGNTGISFAAIGRILGHRVKIIMPDWLSQERISIIESMGAEIMLVSKEQGGFLGSIALSHEMAAGGGVFLPKQFENRYNSQAHEYTTGPEIVWQLKKVGLRPDAFVAGVGSGGTVMGVGDFLRLQHHAVRIHPLEPAESPTLSTGHKVGSHRIQGISDEFIPAIVDLKALDGIVQAHDGDAILMAQKLAWQLGLAVGISSGANLIGAIKLKEDMGKDATVVTLLCDDNKKYLSTDLTKVEPPKDGYLSPDVSFTGFIPMGRLEKPPFHGVTE